jgi:hypothetical protein
VHSDMNRARMKFLCVVMREVPAWQLPKRPA